MGDEPFSIGTTASTEELSQQQRGVEAGDNSGTYWAELVSTLNQSSVVISRRKDNAFRLKCESGEVCWRPMVTTHWPRLFNYTGYNMDGRYGMS